VNCALKQFEALMQKKMEERESRMKFLHKATLLDLAADVIVKSQDLVIALVAIIPEGNPPWYAVLRAWYRKHRQRPRSLSYERFPMKRLLKMMNIEMVIE
jgi:hypothetical protein